MRPGGHLGYVGVFHDAEPSLSPTFRTTRVPPDSQMSQWWGTGLWVCWQCWPPSSSAPSLRLARWLDDTDN